MPSLLSDYSLLRHGRYVTAMGHPTAGHQDQDDHGGYYEVAHSPLKIEQKERILVLFFLLEMSEECCNILLIIIPLPCDCIYSSYCRNSTGSNTAPWTTTLAVAAPAAATKGRMGAMVFTGQYTVRYQLLYSLSH